MIRGCHLEPVNDEQGKWYCYIIRYSKLIAALEDFCTKLLDKDVASTSQKVLMR